MIISPLENDYIDIHTHSMNEEEGSFRILNAYPDEANALPSGRPVSIGLHPWYITKSSDKSVEKILAQSAHLPQVKAIGETGLDKLCNIPLDWQEKVFIIHIKLAYKLRKPLIIHCVRAYSEIMRLKKNYSSEIFWIIHGFNGSISMARELTSKGFYLSLGNRILRNEKKSLELASSISPERIFIETDEDEITVKTVYDKWAGLYNMDTGSLRQIIMNNYLKVFKV